MTNPNRTVFALYGYQKKKKREKRTASVTEEVTAENFPTLGKEIVSEVMEVHRSPSIRDPRKTSRHII